MDLLRRRWASSAPTPPRSTLRTLQSLWRMFYERLVTASGKDCQNVDASLRHRIHGVHGGRRDGPRSQG